MWLILRIVRKPKTLKLLAPERSENPKNRPSKTDKERVQKNNTDRQIAEDEEIAVFTAYQVINKIADGLKDEGIVPLRLGG